MHDPLETYLNDHLAGADLGIRLLEHLKESDRAGMREFAAAVLAEIEADRNVLEQLIDRVGAAAPLKRAAGRLGGLLSRLKLGSGAPAFGAFETLELLAVGVHGKLCLWRALEEIQHDTPALHGIQLEVLAGRALEQHARIEQQRLALARDALLSPSVPAPPTELHVNAVGQR